MAESDMRQKLVKALVSFDAVPVENKLRSGHPDINAIGFDIECKWKKFWPDNCDTNPVEFKHPLSLAQGYWLRRRWNKGGYTFVAAQVSKEWFFFSGETSKDLFGKMTRPEMKDNALFHSVNFNKEGLITWLNSLCRKESN
jgi:hypothetical protein